MPHLDEQLVERVLALRVAATHLARASGLANSVNLIDIYDTRGVLTGLGKEIADARRTNACECHHKV